MKRSFVRAFARAMAFCAVMGSVSPELVAQDATDSNITYTYDDLGRLKSAVYSDGTEHTYTYDAAGNRLTHEVGSALPILRLWNGYGVEATGSGHQADGKIWFTVWRARSSTLPVSVEFETYICTGSGADEGGCDTAVAATPGADYTPVSGGTVTIAPSESGTAQTFWIQSLPDNLQENNEFIYVRLKPDTAVNATIDPDRRHSAGRIKDVDGDLIRFQLNGPRSGEEDKTLIFRVLKLGAAKQAHSVYVSTNDKTAVAGEDYVPVGKWLTFEEGVTELAVEVRTLNDVIYEGDEQFELVLSDPTGGAVLESNGANPAYRAVVTINDAADLPLFSIGNSGSYEGDDPTRWGGVDYWLNNNFTQPITVDYEIILPPGGATTDDFVYGTPFSGSFMIPPNYGPNASSGGDNKISFEIKGDTVPEPDEQVIVRITGLKNARKNPQRLGRDGELQSTFVIRNDDSDKPIFSIHAQNDENYQQTDEGEPLWFVIRRRGNTSGTQTISYKPTEDPWASSTPFSVSRKRATRGEDYRFPEARRTVTFETDETEKLISIETVATVPDVHEGIEWVYIRLEEPSVGSVSRGEAGGKIMDGDAPRVTITGRNAGESTGKIVFDVTLDHASEQDTWLRYATTGGGTATLGEDYKSWTDKLIIPAHQLSGEIEIELLDDNLAEGDETLEVSIVKELDASHRGQEVTIPGGRITATGTIIDDSNDSCNMKASIGASGAVDEGDGGRVFHIETKGGCPTTGNAGGILGMAMLAVGGMDAHEYRLEVISGTAEDGKDFKGKSLELQLLPDSSMPIPLEVIDDIVNEANEDLKVRLVPASSTDLSGKDAPFIIIDNDPGPVFDVSDVTVPEGNLVVFTVTKTGETETVSSVVYRTVDGEALAGEDYAPQSGILIFEPEETEKTLVVYTTEDSTFEQTETFTLHLSNATSGAAVGRETATVTIEDDDAGPLFSVSDAQAVEGGVLQFHVVLSKPSVFEHLVSFETNDDTAVFNSDYRELSGQLSFKPGQTHQSVMVATLRDNIADPLGTERMVLRLTDPTGGAKLGDGYGTGTILDAGAEAIADPAHAYFIPAGSNVHISMAGGAGGDGARQSGSVDGAPGGLASLQFVAGNGFYLRAYAGKKGRDAVTVAGSQVEPTGGSATDASGPDKAGDGGGASSIIVSSDGVSWVPVAIVGGGGGSGSYGSNRGGGGGGLNQPGINSPDGRGGRGASVSAPGAGGIDGLSQGGNGGAPGQPGSAGSTARYPGGQGDSEFGIGGGGGAECIRSGGGGSGRSGGGGSACVAGGGGGSGYWDASSWQQIAGVVPTIITNTTGSNPGYGYVRFEATDQNGGPAYEPTNPNPGGVLGRDADESGVCYATDRTNLLDLSGWPTGAAPTGTASMPGWRAPQDFLEETAWEVVEGPLGAQVVAMKTGDTDGDAIAGGHRSPIFGISPDKAYQFSVYFKKFDTSKDTVVVGPEYTGANAANARVERAWDQADEGNPQFAAISPASQSVLDPDRWYRLVGYVLPDGHPEIGQYDLGGIFDATTGAKVLPTNTYRLKPGVSAQSISFFGMRTGDPVGFSTYFYGPEVREACGSEIAGGDAWLGTNVTPSFEISDASREEGGALSYVVSARYPVANAVTLAYSTADGTATSTDYQASTGNLTFAVGERIKVLQVQTLEDTEPEDDETVVVQLNVASGSAHLARAQATGVIVNDDTPPSFTLVSEPVKVFEGESARFTVMKQQYSENSYSLEYDIIGGTATEGVDYLLGSGTLSLDASEMSKALVIQTVDDGVVDGGDETFILRIKNASGGATIENNQVTGTIGDNQEAGIAGSFANAVEGNSLVLTLTRTGDLSKTHSIQYRTIDGTAIAGTDYTAKSDAVTFLADQETKSINILTTHDTEYENNERVDVELFGASPGVVYDDTLLSAWIMNDDAEPAFSVNDVSVSEGGNLMFTILLDRPSKFVHSVNFTTAESATNPAHLSTGVFPQAHDDYSVANGTLTFSPGQTSKTVTVSTTDDVIHENDEQVLLVISGPTGGATIADDTGVGTILNNDDGPVMSVSDASVTEGGNLVFTITKTGQTQRSTPISYSTANGTATIGDYAEVPTPAEIVFGHSEYTKTVSIATTNDPVYEVDETILFNLSIPKHGATIGDGQGIGTIVDNDPVPSFSVSDAVATEGGNLVFTISRSVPSSVPHVISYTTGHGTAKGPDYYGEASTITILPADTSQTVSIQTKTDSIYEGPETIRFTLLDVSNAATISDEQGIGTINDANIAPAFGVNDVSVSEGGDLIFTVMMTVESVSTHEVSFATAQSETYPAHLSTGVFPQAHDDYSVANGTLTFSPGQTSKTVTVSTTDDVIHENDEQVLLVISGPTGGATIADDTGVGTILNNDDGPVMSVSDASVTEGGNLVFTITKTGQTQRSTPISYSTANGSASYDDYVEITSPVEIVFGHSEYGKTVTIATTEDTTIEANETIHLNLSNAKHGATIGDGQGVGTIVNNDFNVMNKTLAAASPSVSTTDGEVVSLHMGATAHESEHDLLPSVHSMSSGKFYVEFTILEEDFQGPLMGIGPTNINYVHSTMAQGKELDVFLFDIKHHRFTHGLGDWESEKLHDFDNILPAVGVVYGIAVDIDNHKIYTHRNGVYFNGANPAAGSGSLTTLPAGKNWRVVMGDQWQSGVTTKLKVNLGQAAYAYTPPSGFGAFPHN